MRTTRIRIKKWSPERVSFREASVWYHMSIAGATPAQVHFGALFQSLAKKCQNSRKSQRFKGRLQLIYKTPAPTPARFSSGFWQFHDESPVFRRHPPHNRRVTQQFHRPNRSIAPAFRETLHRAPPRCAGQIGNETCRSRKIFPRPCANRSMPTRSVPQSLTLPTATASS